MKLTDYLRRFKPAYSLYNFFFPKYLKHNLSTFHRFNIRKNYFESVNSEDFKLTKTSEQPWLDREFSRNVLPDHIHYQSLPEKEQEAIINWSEKGYAIIKGFYSESEIVAINNELNALLASGKVKRKANGKIMFAIHESEKLKEIVSTDHLEEILSLLLGKRVRLFQSINFTFGSQQKAHSDSIHMTTFPPGYLIAVWIALEKITMGNGPLFFYPGSHRLPYIMNRYFQSGRNKWWIGRNDYSSYEKKD